MWESTVVFFNQKVKRLIPVDFRGPSQERMVPQPSERAAAARPTDAALEAASQCRPYSYPWHSRRSRKISSAVIFSEGKS